MWVGSFTLTMWDVKSIEIREYQYQVISFTLTMWDVKISNYKYKNGRIWFYLNYVGCKEIYF